MNADVFTLPPGNVQIAFSGGRTSALMLHRLIEANGDVIRDEDRVQIIFTNTGREMPQTLDFVAEVGRRWQVPITWIEWAPGEAGQRYQVTGYQGAARNGEPFEAMIRWKQYLPNALARFCTSELKVRPANHYLQNRGWKNWSVAIGFRADEAHRGARDLRERFVRWTPLIEAGITLQDVKTFWKAAPFDLQLSSHGRTPLGNCDGCFLKSEKHQAALARDYPDRAAWWEAMEAIVGEWKGEESAAQFSKRYSRREIREFIEKQGDWILDTEGALCQADDGECFA